MNTQGPTNPSRKHKERTPRTRCWEATTADAHPRAGCLCTKTAVTIIHDCLKHRDKYRLHGAVQEVQLTPQARRGNAKGSGRPQQATLM